MNTKFINMYAIFLDFFLAPIICSANLYFVMKNVNNLINFFRKVQGTPCLDSRRNKTHI
jgi:hypothetical protein